MKNNFRLHYLLSAAASLVFAACGNGNFHSKQYDIELGGKKASLVVLYDGNDIMNYHSHFANETNIAWINSTRSREIKNGIPSVNLIAATCEDEGKRKLITEYEKTEKGWEPQFNRNCQLPPEAPGLAKDLEEQVSKIYKK